MGRGTAAILLSRQSLYPTGADAWVLATYRAMHWVKQREYRLVATVGMPTWDMTVTIAALFDIPLTILLPPSAAADVHLQQICDEFDLHGRDIHFHVVAIRDMRKDAVYAKLDRQVIETADILIPVSIRPNGTWSTLLADTTSFEKQIVTEFQIPYERRKERVQQVYTDAIAPDIDALNGKYLFHWTRATAHPSPNERPIDFYRAIIAAADYPRSAFATLQNILKTNRLFASHRHMAQGVRTVSFSSLSPRDTIPRMRWRQRYREMSFEPYAIGIRKEAAFAAGMRPVEYLQAHEMKLLTDPNERWRFQSCGKKTDWRQEQEYRYPATLSLSDFKAEDLVVITRTSQEAEQVAAEFQLPSHALFQDTRATVAYSQGQAGGAAPARNKKLTR